MMQKAEGPQQRATTGERLTEKRISVPGARKTAATPDFQVVEAGPNRVGVERLRKVMMLPRRERTTHLGVVVAARSIFGAWAVCPPRAWETFVRALVPTLHESGQKRLFFRRHRPIHFHRSGLAVRVVLNR